MIKKKFKAFCTKKGKLHFYDPAMVLDAINEVKGKYVTITIEETKVPKSQSQLAYFFVVLAWLRNNTEEFAGWTEEMQLNFLYAEFSQFCYYSELDGKYVEYVVTKSISQMGQYDFNRFVNNVFAFLAMQGIDIPPPETPINKRWK